MPSIFADRTREQLEADADECPYNAGYTLDWCDVQTCDGSPCGQCWQRYYIQRARAELEAEAKTDD